MQPDRILGVPRLNEGESFRNLLEALKVCESCCRQLAFLRQEKRWILAQSQFERLRAVLSALHSNKPTPLEHQWLS